MKISILCIHVSVAMIATLVLSVHAESGADWNYLQNGADWGGIGRCAKGGAQSPIDLPQAVPVATDDQAIFLKYPKLSAPLKVYHNGKSIAFTLPEAFKAGFGIGSSKDGVKAFESEDAEAYRLWQVTFHAPSEHTMNGQRMPLEVQLVHQRVTGGDNLAVVVVLFQDAPNTYGAFLDKVIGTGLPKKPWDEVEQQPPLEFTSLLGGSPYYSYEGSLTVPPCERRVKYFVREEPVLADRHQTNAFRSIIKATCKPEGNFRAAQPPGGPIHLMASIDAVTDPEAIVKPKVSKLSEEEVKKPAVPEASPAEQANPEYDCSKYADDVWKNRFRLRAYEPDQLAKAKTSYRYAENDYVAQQQAVANSKRNLAGVEGMYKNTPGVVEKINLKWGVINAKTVLGGASGGLQPKKDKLKAEKANLEKVAIASCHEYYAKLAAIRAAAEKAAAEKAAAAKKAPVKKVEKEKEVVPPWVYPEPQVVLPRGFEASPFSDKQPQAMEAFPDKIAVNLRQAEVPEALATSEAPAKKSGELEKPPIKQVVLRMTLPIVPNAAGGQAAMEAKLIKALSKKGTIPAERLRIKSVQPARMQKVAGSDPRLRGA